jgi:hypothetical protein
MIDISVIIDTRDLKRILRAIDAVYNTAVQSAKNLPRQFALEYADVLRGNIRGGNIAVAGRYSPRYIEYKRKEVGHLRPWILRGDLLANITVHREGNEWFAGVPAGIKDSGGKGWFGTGAPSFIGAYARANEFGLGPTPERPMFRPSLQHYIGAGAVNHITIAKQKLKRRWR